MPNFKKLEFSLLERRLIDVAFQRYMEEVDFVRRQRTDIPANAAAALADDRSGFLIMLVEQASAPPLSMTPHARRVVPVPMPTTVEAIDQQSTQEAPEGDAAAKA
jgi:hypothetical protein